MYDDDRMVCTGAIRRLDDETCELKRLWLLPDYQRQGLGYRMLMELSKIAREMGYKRMWLQTDIDAQSRAVDFYKQIGFHEIPRYGDRNDDICMGITL